MKNILVKVLQTILLDGNVSRRGETILMDQESVNAFGPDYVLPVDTETEQKPAETSAENTSVNEEVKTSETAGTETAGDQVNTAGTETEQKPADDQSENSGQVAEGETK